MAKPFRNNFNFKFPEGQAISFDVEAFDNLIRSQGVQLVHFRALKCPVGMIDMYDQRKPHEDHAGCSNGYLYTEAGTITALFTGVSEELKQMDAGLVDGSVVQVTTPRYYDDTEGEEIKIHPYDRLYLADSSITVIKMQLVEAHITGRQRLSFPVVRVIDLIDANGRRYTENDYSIEKGQLVWKGQPPGFDAESATGTVFSVKFEYHPFYYVTRMMHEIRLSQVETPVERKVMRMPQQFMLAREFLFHNETKDDQAPDPESPRQGFGPREGVFGPR